MGENGDAHAYLATLHRIHRQLSDLRERLERGPRLLKARQGNLKRLEEALQQAKGAVQAARMAADSKELHLRTNEQKIQQLQVKLNMVKTPREYQALQDQIAADRMACSVLSDEILEALERVDKSKAEVPPAEKAIRTAQAELKTATAAVDAERPGLQSEIQRLEAELLKTEKSLPKEIVAPYERVVRSKGADGLAPLERGVCSGCHMAVPPNQDSEIRHGAVVFCRTCGRLLYPPEERVFGGLVRD